MRSRRTPEARSWKHPPRWFLALAPLVCLLTWSLGARTPPLHLVVEGSIEGGRITLPLAWGVLALDTMLVLWAAATPRHRHRIGGFVRATGWLFGAMAWMLGVLVCLAMGGPRWFAAGLLLLGIGVIPVGIYVGVLVRHTDPLVLSLIAMTLATLGAWYLGRRLQRSSASATPAPRAGASIG